MLTPGSGASPDPTDEVDVNYRGIAARWHRVRQFSYKRGQPATFPVGHVIPGWTEALQLMKPGSKYQLWIPPQLAYDTQSAAGHSARLHAAVRRRAAERQVAAAAGGAARGTAN